MSDYDWTVSWPYHGANHVVVTGTFDNWSLSRVLRKNPVGTFETVVQIPHGQKVLYKFMVDGRWIAADNSPTEYDSVGNLNNVFFAPERPGKVEETKPEPISARDVATTVVATDGVSSPLSYVASGIGAAIKAVMGVDPVNADKIPVETPKTEAAAPPPASPAVSPEPTKAPIIPISIVPVNDASNNTSSEPKVNENAPEVSTHAPVTPPTLVAEQPKPEAPVSLPEPEAAPAPEPTSVVPEATSSSELPAPIVEPLKPELTVREGDHELVESPVIVEAPKMNGPTPRPSTPPPVESSTTPSTPTRKPTVAKSSSTDSPSKLSAKGPMESPGKASFDSTSKRSGSLRIAAGSLKKKRASLTGKIKQLFHHHHDKEGSK